MGIWLGRVTPRVGDIVVFDWNSSGSANHVVLVDSAAANGSFVSLDGNWSNTVQRACRAAVLYNRQVHGIIRPNYDR